MGNMTDDAEWIIAPHVNLVVFHPMTNLVASWIGYALLAVMFYACVKRRVFWKRAHDVFLLLVFAFIADFLEMRLNFFLAFGMIDNDNGHGKHASTTVGACTLGVWVFYFHFLYTYVEAIVTSYRFITRTLGKALSVAYVYVGLGIVFALQGSLLFETYFHGKPESVVNEHVAWPVICTEAYVYEGPALISQFATAIAMSIAPILSVIMMFKKSKSAKKESGVTAFNLFSSFSMMFLVYIYLSAMYLDIGKYIPTKLGYILNMMMYAAINIQHFRFPLLCVSAIICVADIRDAVLPCLVRSAPKQSTLPQTITNANYVDDNDN